MRPAKDLRPKRDRRPLGAKRVLKAYCRGDERARTLPRAGEETPDADVLLPGSIDAQDGCTWRSGDVDTFSIGMGLTRKDLFHSACATAHDGPIDACS